jgi:nicotinamidase/pyrazinamidase
MNAMQLMRKDALLVVDVQNDFLPGGSLAVPKADEIIPILNRYIAQFVDHLLPIYATRDWHPVDHCSFQAQGGPWPPHCIADTSGARFAANLDLPSDVLIVSKATTPQKDAYSGFEGTDLARRLRSQGVERLFIGGLATDYCVLNTVKDALANGFVAFLLRDAVRAVDVHPGDGEAAISEMIASGAHPVRYENIAEGATHSLP